MKKIMVLLCLLIIGVSINVKAYTLPEKTKHEKVVVHIFRGKDCPHCYDALEYFTKHKDLHDYIDIKVYEVWNNKKNYDFLIKFLESQGKEYEGVPHIVIGSVYNEAGFQNYMAPDIVNAALGEYQNKDYEDILGKMSKDYDIKSQSLEEAWKEENGESTVGLAIAIGIILGVAIGGYLLIRKK